MIRSARATSGTAFWPSSTRRTPPAGPPTRATWKNIIYQQQRGEIAIGSGGIFGNGLFSGRYYSVPNAHNDFILSWMGNAMGFVGLCIVLGALLALVIKTFATGARSEDLLGSYICAGIGGALMAQIAVNVGMNLRVLPVIGVTLPFYSAGGSSVLMLYICVGLSAVRSICTTQRACSGKAPAHRSVCSSFSTSVIRLFLTYLTKKWFNSLAICLCTW